ALRLWKRDVDDANRDRAHERERHARFRQRAHREQLRDAERRDDDRMHDDRSDRERTPHGVLRDGTATVSHHVGHARGAKVPRTGYLIRSDWMLPSVITAS